MTNTDERPTEEPLEINESYEEPELDVEVSVDASLEKAIETYRKLREQKGPLTDEELSKAKEAENLLLVERKKRIKDKEDLRTKRLHRQTYYGDASFFVNEVKREG